MLGTGYCVVGIIIENVLKLDIYLHSVFNFPFSKMSEMVGVALNMVYTVLRKFANRQYNPVLSIFRLPAQRTLVMNSICMLTFAVVGTSHHQKSCYVYLSEHMQ